VDNACAICWTDTETISRSNDWANDDDECANASANFIESDIFSNACNAFADFVSDFGTNGGSDLHPNTRANILSDVAAK
jgi:hypothetical protein